MWYNGDDIDARTVLNLVFKLYEDDTYVPRFAVRKVFLRALRLIF